MKTNYDDLSERGREQATALGRHLSAHKWRFTTVYTGPAMRHRDTAKLAGQAVTEAGRPWPEPRELVGLDEHDAFSLVRASVGSLADDEEVTALRQQMLSASSRDDRSARFQRLFEAVMTRWLRGDFEPRGVETWPQFRARVLSCLETITASAESGARVLAFSSVGPVAVLLQRALATTDLMSFQIAWRLRNSALTSFMFDGKGRFSLDYYNALPHMPDPKAWTFR